MPIQKGLYALSNLSRCPKALSFNKNAGYNFHNRSQSQLVTDCHQLNVKQLIVDFYEV